MIVNLHDNMDVLTIVLIANIFAFDLGAHQVVSIRMRCAANPGNGDQDIKIYSREGQWQGSYVAHRRSTWVEITGLQDQRFSWACMRVYHVINLANGMLYA